MYLVETIMVKNDLISSDRKCLMSISRVNYIVYILSHRNQTFRPREQLEARQYGIT